MQHSYPQHQPDRRGGFFAILALAAAALFLPACSESSATQISAQDAKSNRTQSMTKPMYSQSGHDLTPLTKEEIAKICETLTPEQIQVTQHAGTERAFCGDLTYTRDSGIYVSVVGGLPLFKSESKFESKSGWASFFEPFDSAHIIEREDATHGMVRVEILDARSGAHLGHVFEDGPPPTGKRYCLNSAALKFIPEGQPIPKESQPADRNTAFFAGGCFWSVEDQFQNFSGVIDAASGYQNGKDENPTYREVCSGSDHAEAVKVVFDPDRVTYEQLVRFFFTIHNPTTRNRQGPDVGTQYRSGIFAISDRQAEVARKVIDELTEAGTFGDREIVTIIEPAGRFWMAEDYHQDYNAKHGRSCAAP